MTDVRVFDTSRYKDTFAYTDAAGPVIGPFQAPPEFAADDTWLTVRVSSAEVGFLDRIAVSAYGPGYEWAWSFIALANGIVDVDVDAAPGALLRIPPLDVLNNYRRRVSLNA